MPHGVRSGRSPVRVSVGRVTRVARVVGARRHMNAPETSGCCFDSSAVCARGTTRRALRQSERQERRGTQRIASGSNSHSHSLPLPLPAPPIPPRPSRSSTAPAVARRIETRRKTTAAADGATIEPLSTTASGGSSIRRERTDFNNESYTHRVRVFNVHS